MNGHCATRESIYAEVIGYQPAFLLLPGRPSKGKGGGGYGAS